MITVSVDSSSIQTDGQPKLVGSDLVWGSAATGTESVLINCTGNHHWTNSMKEHTGITGLILASLILTPDGSGHRQYARHHTPLLLHSKLYTAEYSHKCKVNAMKHNLRMLPTYSRGRTIHFVAGCCKRRSCFIMLSVFVFLCSSWMTGHTDCWTGMSQHVLLVLQTYI